MKGFQSNSLRFRKKVMDIFKQVCNIAKTLISRVMSVHLHERFS
jgi:hypothetical protein